jgi:hypothetical protein
MHDEDEPRTMKQTLPADVETRSLTQYALQALTDGGGITLGVIGKQGVDAAAGAIKEKLAPPEPSPVILPPGVDVD